MRGAAAPAWLGALCLAFACARALPVAAPVEPAAAPAGGTPDGLAGVVRSVEAVGQGLEFPLPDADGWRRDEREVRTWVAWHPATRSRLMARAWRADGIARAPDCEAQLRAWRPDLPRLAPDAILEARPLDIGAYAARLQVGVAAGSSAADGLIGHALVFGSDGRNCIGLAFSTSATGNDASRVLGERLGLMSRLVFERVRRVEIGARVLGPPM